MDIVLFPNPAKNVLHWANAESFENFKVFNAIGQLVKSGVTAIGQMDLSTIASGMYVIVFNAADGKMVKQKFIKE